MTTKKRFLTCITALTLLCSMVLSTMTLCVGAAEADTLTGFADAADITYTEAVSATAALGLFAGIDGKFAPNGTVTRAQMATIMVKMLKGSDFNADAYKGEANPFPDTAAFEGGWAEGYINACAQLGIVKGYGDGTFQPGKQVTAAEALTMVLNALKVDAGEGEWPSTVMAKAAELKLAAGLNTEPAADKVLNREELAVIVNAGVQYKPASNPVDPIADGELNILLIGNSYSYYWTDELWGLLDAAGYKNVTVTNAYYSGCTFEKHWTWHQEDKANYTVFSVTEAGRKSEKERDLDYCMELKNWDFISFQQSGTYMYSGGEEAHRESMKSNLPELYEFVKSQHPNAKYLWMQSWTHELGKGNVITREDQDKIAEAYKVVSKEICAQYPFTNVPCGDAWQAVRHDPLLYKEGELTLHTRIFLKKPNHDDKSHDGDVGGGQYLNACVYFEKITGQSVVGNTFRPKYIYTDKNDPNLKTDLSPSEEKIALFQNAAHNAVMGQAAN